MPENEESVNQRIRLLIQQKQMTQRAFAESIGTSQTSIASLLGIRESRPGYEILEKILRAFPDVSPDWLLLGNGPTLRHAVHSLVPIENNNPLLTLSNAERKVLQAEIELLKAQVDQLKEQVHFLVQQASNK